MGSTWKEYAERQKEWIKKHNLKVGDKVKVLRRAENHKGGWGTYWPCQIDDTVGKTYEVDTISDYSIRLRLNKESGGFSGYFDWWYPYFVLEPVKQEPKTPKPKYKPYTKTMTLAQIREFYQKGG
jgi:hypothetical protein